MRETFAMMEIIKKKKNGESYEYLKNTIFHNFPLLNRFLLPPLIGRNYYGLLGHQMIHLTPRFQLELIDL